MGNTNLRKSQIGVEGTVGSIATATVQLNGALSMTDERQRELRDERRASMGGSNTYDDLSYQSTGRYTGRCVVRELPYFLASSIDGTITPTTPGGTTPRLWTFTQPLTTIPALKSLSSYSGDNTQALVSLGTYTRQIVIRGTDTAVWTIEAELLGRELTTGTFASISALTGGALLDQSSVKNLLSKLYIDAQGGTIGSTQKTQTSYSFVWTWNSGIAPDYTMDATLDMTDIQRDAPTCTLEIITKWNSNAVTEFGHWRSGAVRLVRVENEGSTIESTYKRRIRLDGAYVYTGFTPLDNERDGTTLGRLTLTAVEDPDYTKKVEVTVQNALASL